MAAVSWGVTIEQLSNPAGVLRCAPPGLDVESEYRIAATAEWVTKKTVMLKGTTHRELDGHSALSSEFLKAKPAIVEAFRKLGVETIFFERRRKDGRSALVRIKTGPAETTRTKTSRKKPQ